MRKKNLLTAGIIIFIFTSCTTYRYIYTASPANNPYFKKQGESKLAAYYSSAGGNRLSRVYARGTDLQGAYAITNNWALTVAYLNRREKDVYSGRYSLYDSSVVKYKRNLFEAGGGYFISLDKKKDITANLYAGVASGKFSFKDNGLDGNHLFYSRYHESRITKWFFQPSINFMPGENVRFSFVGKISYVHYGKIQTSYTSDELQYFGLDRIANRTIAFFEPSFNLQFAIPGYPWIKIDAIFSGTSNTYYTNTHLTVRSPNGSIGLIFDFSKIKKKNK